MSSALQALRDGFRPLGDRSLRIYLSGQALSLTGTWIQSTAQGWIVWEMTGSTAPLGVVAMLGFLPFLLMGPWTGVWSDRFDRRKLLMGLQAAAMLLAVLLALLIQTDSVQLWHVYLLSAVLGAIHAIDMPAQQAFVGDLAGIHQVRPAMVLNNALAQVSRMAGPALAGWLIGQVGPSSAFWLNALSFAAVIASLAAITSQQVRRPSSGRPLSEFAEGVRFVGGQPRIQDLMFLSALLTVFGISNLQILPAYAAQAFAGSAELYGALMGASGAGALVGSVLLTPVIQRLRRTGLALAGAVVWTGVWFAALAWAPHPALAWVFVFLTGVGVPVVVASTSGFLQVMAPPDMRGRLLSAYLMLTFGIQPFAALAVGYSAAWLGAGTAIGLNGLLMALSTLGWLALRSGLRRWEAGAQAA